MEALIPQSTVWQILSAVPPVAVCLGFAYLIIRNQRQAAETAMQEQRAVTDRQNQLIDTWWERHETAEEKQFKVIEKLGSQIDDSREKIQENTAVLRDLHHLIASQNDTYTTLAHETKTMSLVDNEIRIGVPGGTLTPLFLPDEELESTGILSQTRPWTHNFHGIDALHAAGRLGSKRVLVAVLDTGVQVPPHPDLSHIDYQNSLDFVRQGLNDLNGHGTHCTGTVTATAANRVLGVAPNCAVIHYKVLTNQGSGGGNDIARAIRQVAAIQGYDVKIISGSFGSSREDPTISAAVREAHRAGVIQIYAAGNSGPNSANWPGALPEVIAVGACDSNGNIANFSSWLGDYVDVIAGGVNIPSTYPGDRTAVLNGTSMATPLVAGVVAVGCAFSIEFAGVIPTDAQVKEALYDTCRRIGSGRTERGGWGIVRAPEFADRLARSLKPVNPPQPDPEQPKKVFKINVPKDADVIEITRV